MNDISENIQNLGCLPTPYELIDFKREEDWNWECHEGTGKICAGFVAVCKDKNLDYKSGNLLDADYYLKTGNKRPKTTHSENK
mgnify:FL=1